MYFKHIAEEAYMYFKHIYISRDTKRDHVYIPSPDPEFVRSELPLQYFKFLFTAQLEIYLNDVCKVKEMVLPLD